MYVENKDVIHYIALYNENYSMPAIIDEKEDTEGILRGMYGFRDYLSVDGKLVEFDEKHSVQLLGSGPIMQEVLKAAEWLIEKGITSRVWSVTSYGELHRDASENERIQRLSGYQVSQSENELSWVEAMLDSIDSSVVVAVSDNIRAVPELIRPWVKGQYIVLGTDGFGRSDTRSTLRRFFEIDAEHIILAALAGLVRKGTLDVAIFDAAKQEFGIDIERNDIASL